METWKAYNIGIYPCLTYLNNPESYRNSTEEYTHGFRGSRGALISFLFFPSSAIDILSFTGTAVLESLPDGEAFPEIYKKTDLRFLIKKNMEITGNRRLSPLADLGKARSCASPFFLLLFYFSP